MRLFITGASGFVGGAIAIDAIGKGHEVFAMSRSESSDKKIRALGATPVRCSLTDVNASHLKDCDAVVHSAAFVVEWGGRKEFWEANVTGTENMLSAAKEAGVKRFIHIGTEAVLFRGQDMFEVNEETPYPSSTPFLYSETKREAEKRVIQSNTVDFEALSIRPRLVWGPGDQSVLPTILQAIRSKSYRWIDDGKSKSSMTHIHNLSHAIFLALESDKKLGGEIFFVTDDEVWTYKDFFTRLLRTQGIKVPFPSVPGWLARSAAYIVEKFWYAAKIKSPPPVTRFGANILSRHCTIKIDKIKRELGYQPVIDVKRGMEEMPRLR